MSRATRPLYFRILRVRHLNPRPLVILTLFEGSIALGLLLALADLVSGWGVLIIPIAVALGVKLNDVIAGTMIRPLALAQLRTPRPGDGVAVGRSPIPRPSYPTTWIESDDAVADPAAQLAGPEGDPESDLGGDSDPGPTVARGVASVPEASRPNGTRPRPGISTGEFPVVEPDRPDEALEPPAEGLGPPAEGSGTPAEGSGASVPATGPAQQTHSLNTRPVPARPGSIRPDGADRRSRGNTGRFA